MLLEIRVRIRDKKKDFAVCYRYVPREKLMRQLKDITEHQCYNEFVDLFIEAFEDMDTQ